MAELAALRNQPQKAARLWGAANAINELHIHQHTHIIDLWPYERLELERMANTICARLDEATLKLEQEAGRQMTLEQAIDYALNIAW